MQPGQQSVWLKDGNKKRVAIARKKKKGGGDKSVLRLFADGFYPARPNKVDE